MTSRTDILDLSQIDADDEALYDIAARCARDLINLAPNPAAFLAKYCKRPPEDKEGPSGAFNPNLEALEQLEEDVFLLASQEQCRQIPTPIALNSLARRASEVRLKPYGETALNKLTVKWFVLRGIDRGIGEAPILAKSGPLNSVLTDELGIYLTPPNSPLKQAVEQFGVTRVPELSFNNELQTLLIHRKDPSVNLPKVIRARTDADNFKTGAEHSIEHREIVERILHDDAASTETPPLPPLSPALSLPDSPATPLRIGVCVGSRERIESFGGDTPIQFFRTQGLAFAARYSADYDEALGDAVVDVLVRASSHGCHIVAFPELVMSPGLQKRVGEHLHNTRNEPGSLLYVVAGSGWTDDNNNISVAFDRFGRRVGTCYKRHPYVDRDITYVEDLSAPGDTRSATDIEGIGRVLTLVCKDLVEREQFDVMELASDLHIDLMLIPAFSTSIRGAFELPLATLSQSYLTSAVIANYCGCVKDRPQEDGQAKAAGTAIGLVSTPGKPDTGHRANPIIEPIARTEACGACAFKATGPWCLRVVDIIDKQARIVVHPPC